MKKVLSLMLCALMALSLAGCGSSGTDSSTYVFSSDLDVKNLDSSDADDGCSFTAMNACIEGLMGLDKDGKITPAIAEKEEVSEDGLVHTFTLRKDAKWSNGDPVTADDFVYAFKRIFKNVGNYYYLYGDSGASIVGAQEMCDKLDNGEELTDEDFAKLGAVAEDDKTLVITTTTNIQYFDDFMMFPAFYPINQKFCEEKGDQYGKSADGVLSNGAYILDTWDVGSKITFKKNEDFYDAKNVKMENIEMKLVQAPEVAATSFENGETDFAPVSSDLVDKYKDEDTFQTVNDGFLFYLSINFNNPDLANQNIRKALSLAIDRKDLCDNKLKDGSSPAKGFIPSGLSHDTDGKDFRETAGTYTDYDKDEAQKAFDAGLKELGKDQITIRLLYGTDESPMDQIATYLQSSFSKIDGLNIEMVATTKQDRIYTKQKNRDFDIACTRWGPDYSDPTTYLTLLQTNNTNNYGDYSNAAYDELIDKINKENDPATRWQYMQDAEKMAMEDYGYIPLFEKGTAVLVNKDAKGLLIRSFGVPYIFRYVSK